MTSYPITAASINHFSQQQMATRGFPDAPSGWYLAVKSGKVNGYLCINKDHILPALPARFDPKTGESFYIRTRSRRVRR
jgi:hypothetical protein